MNFTCGVACVLFDPEMNILLQHRAKNPGRGLMVLPGGRMDEPDPRAAMVRELKEELGLSLAPYDLTPCWFAPDILESGEPLLMTYYVAFAEQHLVRNAEPHKCYGLEWYPYSSPMAMLPHGMWANDKAAALAARSIALKILRPDYPWKNETHTNHAT